MIPRVLHRTVPRNTSAEQDHFWLMWQQMHPGWDFMDWRDPLDPRDFASGRLWRQCSSGAQKAGYIRLEVLLKYGGVYVDSDLEPVQSLEGLISAHGLRAFAAWEDERCIPDFFLGAEADHPVVKICLRRAISLGPARGAWATGPGVTTEIFGQWNGRDGVQVFPPETAAPVHYSEKEHLEERRPQWSRNQGTFAVHHWRYSWEGE